MTDTAVPAIRNIASVYARRLLEMLLSRGNTLPRSYGFEYEFLPHRVLNQGDMAELDDLLRSAGCLFSGGTCTRDSRSIVFEPGGQIEYLSPPVTADDSVKLREVLDWIAGVNLMIEKKTGIRYIGTDHIPGRHDAPLLLTSSRYTGMHERFRKVDSRGPEMMKGTAAIHLHAAVTSAGDLEALYTEFCGMSTGRILGMSPARRDIWEHTDGCRCGLPPTRKDAGAGSILESIVDHALDAVELRSGEVFRTLRGRDFPDFLDHLTTMFTDVRVNVKGGTIELRTPDSRPLTEFPAAWEEFVHRCEKVT